MSLISNRKLTSLFLLSSLFLLLYCTDLSVGGDVLPATQVHGCNHDHHHHHHEEQATRKKKIPEEVAEDEDELYDLAHPHHHDEHQGNLSGLGLWVHALGCSLLVSLASLVCLLFLPLIFVKGKPSKAIVDSLALFGAGAMLGDAFLHQLPHALGGEHSHSHDHHHEHSYLDEHSHSHSLKDLSVGLSILAGIVLFLVVEKVVRYVEDNSPGGSTWSHGHHHHHHKSSKKLKDDNDIQERKKLESLKRTEGNGSVEVSDDCSDGDNSTHRESMLRKRNVTVDGKDDKSELDAADSAIKTALSLEEEAHDEPPSNLVFGYLNLFSDGVHNFTDGMALGSAFLLYGSVGGWSRTLFLLAHELPQEVGDFGILVRSGFSVVEALFLNFLSALVALAGTAMALLWGQDPVQSSLIEGFTAGGFIYISVAGVLAEMNSSKSSLRSTAVQVMSLLMGMAVALFISLVE